MKLNINKSILIALVIGFVCTPVYQAIAVLPAPSYLKKIDPRTHKTSWISAAVVAAAVILGISGIAYSVDQHKKELQAQRQTMVEEMPDISRLRRTSIEPRPIAALPEPIFEPEEEPAPLLPAPLQQEPLYENPRMEPVTYPKKTLQELSSGFIKKTYFPDDIFPYIGDGNYEKVQEVLDNGGRVNYVSANFRFTPLTLATEKNNLELVRYFLNHGAETTLEDFNGKTALKYAIENDNPIMVQTLLDKDSDSFVVNSEGSDGLTPLMAAAYYENPYIVNILIHYGAKKKQVNKNGETAYDFLMQPHKNLKKYPTSDRTQETLNRMDISYALTGHRLLPMELPTQPANVKSTKKK